MTKGKGRSAATVAALGVAASLIAFGPATSAQAAGGGGEILIGSTGKCLDNWRSHNADGNTIDQYKCNGSAAQKWSIDYYESNGGLYYYRIRNVATNKCLNVQGQSQNAGAKIVLWDCNGQSDERFNPSEIGSGYYLWRNQNSDKCLNVAGNSGNDGAWIIQYYCDPNAADEWFG
ncbi:RICIN domain-containing protein [Kitasatospora viridis]|uniref:Ricin-type beta-trefoil lectin protein n=1 Tax=Kitasatospora viridis TaxID=281105 RepID=A0A561S9N1_9ACTN|nr:RICIN domain-containing protein [Kitasatospora viridis]TWF71547.1 ricin-type beta-trefoil lectin protein [Kitasatospora viridis]